MKVCSEVEYFSNMYEELCGRTVKRAVKVHCDNLPAVEIANGARGAARTILYGIRYGAVYDAVKRQIVKVEHIPGIENTADVLTKPLGNILFHKYTERLLAD
jgi:hypothetical protein